MGKNFGTWDFTGADHFLTPGYVGDGAGAVEGGTEAMTVGGVYAPAGHAFYSRNFSNANTGLWNYGTMVGDGVDKAVVDIQTLHADVGAGSTEFEFDVNDTLEFDIPNLVSIYNGGIFPALSEPEPDAVGASNGLSPHPTYGVIGSHRTPHAWSFGPAYAFASNFGFQAAGGVDWGFIDTYLLDMGELSRFDDAAGDWLLNLTGPDDDERADLELGDGGGAALLMQNDGLAIGTLHMEFDESASIFPASIDGDGGGPFGDDKTSSFFQNYGTWLTSGVNGFYGGGDAVFNHGLVQAAFRADEASVTTLDELEVMFNLGIVSLLDGAPEDRITFDGVYSGGLGERVVEEQGNLPPNAAFLIRPSFFALDAHLADEDDPEALADVFRMEDEYGGSTGLLVRNANPAGSQGVNQDGITVVEYVSEFPELPDLGGDDADKTPCAAASDEDAPCYQDDIFYISQISPNYLKIGDQPVILDGLYAWMLWNDVVDNVYELRSTWGPGTWNAPKVISGSQFIADELFGIVDDNAYANQFFGPGGSGADLGADYVYSDYGASPQDNRTRTGLWLKATGAWTDRDTTLTEMGTDTDTRYNQNVYSFLGGADMKPGGADSAFRLGLFGGYVTSMLEFEAGAPGTEIEYQGGSAGVYGAYNNGAFYLDTTVKGEYLDTAYTFDSGADVDADVINVGVSANSGYRMAWRSTFLEPIASLRYIYTTVDQTSGGTLDFSDGNSLRVGAAFATGGGTTEISLLGKVWNEFLGDNTVTVSDGGMTDSFTDDTSGVFGEAEATLTMTNHDGTLTGFLSGGGKFGEEFTSWNAQAGVRRGF